MPMLPAFERRVLPIIRELVATYGTPFHLYDAKGILETHREMVAAFEGQPFKQHFAVKALPNPAVLKLLVDAGSGLDCASAPELQLARSVGANGASVVFTSNNTSIAEYQAAIDQGTLITFDDVKHFRRATQLPETVAFRVSPHGAAARSPLMGGPSDSKFGVPRNRLVDAYREAISRGARRFGIHGMTCANELDVGTAILAAEDLIDTAAVLEATLGIAFDYINFGGGIGIPYRPGEVAFPFPQYASAIRTKLKSSLRTAPTVLMECGRCVTGPHGILVTRAINRVTKERELLGLDASMSSLMRPGFYTSAYHHISVPFAGNSPPRALDVVGSLCENVDRFATGRLLPEVDEGDIVFIHDTGAHGHAMGFNYNGRLRCAELMLLEDDSVVEIRRAEGYADYVATVTWSPATVLSSRSAARTRRNTSVDAKVHAVDER